MKKKTTTTLETESVKFELGDIFLRHEVASLISKDDLRDLLLRHQKGDWGALNYRGEQMNALAIERGGVVFSVFNIENDAGLLVVTECDRERTYVASIDDPVWKEEFAEEVAKLAITLH